MPDSFNKVSDPRAGFSAAELQNGRAGRNIPEKIESGFCIIEMISGEDGRATDYRFVETNPAFERQSGLVDAVGHRIRELAPDLAEDWIKRYGRVALTGEAMRLEGQVALLGRWYDINAFRVGAPEKHRVGLLFTDITDRRKAEDGSHASEERQAFLLKLSDALRAQLNDDAVVDLATRMLAKEMGLDRCYAAAIYTDEDRVDIVREFRRLDLTPMPSQLRYSDYPEAAKQSFVQTLVFHDTTNDPALTDTDKRSLAAISFGALISPPLRHGAGKPIWTMGAVSSQPRLWTPGEVALVEDVAERTWAAVERARAEAALRESEERLRTLFDSIDEGYLEMDVVMSSDGRALDWRYVALNPAFQRLSGLSDMTGRLASEFLPNLEPEWAERFAQVVTTGEAARFDIPAAQLDRWFEVYVVRPGGPGTTRLVMVYNNIIERKRAEQALRDDEARQAFLLKLSDALRSIADPLEIQLVAMSVLGEQLKIVGAQYYESTDNGEHFSSFGGYTDGSVAKVERVRLDDFGPFTKEAYRAGRTLVVDDVWHDDRITPEQAAAYKALGVCAYVGVPLIKAGRLVVALGAVHSAPKLWTKEETALVEETAQRTWAAVERARAEADTRQSEQHQRLLLAELQHRVRNILAMVRAIARQSEEGHTDVEEFLSHFTGRIDAMARTQVLLTRAAGARVDLESLVWDELHSQLANEDRTKVEGPDVSLSPKAAEVLALALHELATNSIKYGALSDPSGTLSVSWGQAPLDVVPWLQLTWDEQCRQVQPRPIKPGFGTALIEDRVPYELRGEATLYVTEGGVRAEIAFPLTDGSSILETGHKLGGHFDDRAA